MEQIEETNELQRTEEWYADRRGKVTASKIADVLMAEKTAGHRNYLAQLAVERMTGVTEDTYCSYDMQRGIELEPDAILCYEFITGTKVEKVRFVDHPSVPMSGCSPDGLIMGPQEFPEGLIEIKCPKAATHIDYMLTEKVDGKYIKQMQWQMACTGASWCDFISYNPIMPREKQIVRIRFYRDDETIRNMVDAVVVFNRKVEQMIADIEAA